MIILKLATLKPIMIFVLVTLALFSPCTMMSQNVSDNNIKQFILKFLQYYPEATLLDIYKGAFQDRFGPAHILTDSKAVESYIKSELEEMKKDAPVDVWESSVSHNTKYVNHRNLWDYCEPCGWHANFYRVDLTVLKDGLIPMNVFVDAFMESADGIDTTFTSAWLEEWGETIRIVRRVVPDLHNFSTDSATIARLLSNGKYVVHHSSIFNKNYRPHYRIIRKDVLERIIMSLHK